MSEALYITQDDCLFVLLNDTAFGSAPSFYTNKNYSSTSMRLKVGHHIPAGEYVFGCKILVSVFDNLLDTKDEKSLKPLFKRDIMLDDSRHPGYIICDIRERECVKIYSYGTAVSMSIMTLEESRSVVKLKEYGTYKVGVHLPSGRYTVKGTSEYFQ